jgi:hypothetical protein
VVREAQLSQPNLDSALDVALHGAGGVAAARRMYVIVDQG